MTHGGGTKYPAIMTALRETARSQPGGARLPTLRELAEAYGTTLPTVQRAVNELVGEGILRTRARAGIFVAEGGNALPAPLREERRELTLHLSSTAPRQQAAWDAVFGQFEAEHRYLRVGTGPAARADVREVGPVANAGDEAPPLLDLTPLLGPELAEAAYGGGEQRPFCPVHQHLPCLIVNRDLLAADGLAATGFGSFAEQAAFLHQCERRRAAAGRWGAVTVQQPVLWLGRSLATILDWLRADGDPSRGYVQQLEAALAQIMGLARLLRRNGEGAGPGIAMEWFREGRVAAYLGWTYEVGKLLDQPPDFAWEVVPWLGADGHTASLVVSLGISAGSRRPIEAVRLLRLLRRPEIQAELSAHGMLAVDPAARQLPAAFPTSCRDLWQERLGAVRPLPLLGAEDSYLFRSIIVDEVWAGIHRGLDARQVLRNILDLGRGYRRCREDQQLDDRLA